ncbi:helix-turn-helix domain-containing protein [Romboutsia ilealis]|uniref:helix-turn-helix domain-containing protein n=1 Tax=Romboutsia ilealis TaxID=1115758 RepID=UPI0025733F25|nr:helix-turn-helix transcriptional regulator [Romboutsia ilealis]
MKSKLARIKKGLTQDEVCKMAKISKATLIKVERGDYSPLKYDKIVALANVLGETPEYLFFSDEE